MSTQKKEGTAERSATNLPTRGLRLEQRAHYVGDDRSARSDRVATAGAIGRLRRGALRQARGARCGVIAHRCSARKRDLRLPLIRREARPVLAQRARQALVLLRQRRDVRLEALRLLVLGSDAPLRLAELRLLVAVRRLHLRMCDVLDLRRRALVLRRVARVLLRQRALRAAAFGQRC